MELNEGNTYITKHDDRLYCINIEMPDGSRNYLHHKAVDLESAIIVRELINECSIDHMNMAIIGEDQYYRVIVNIADCNGDKHRFHSRKLNLNDAVYERMQLLKAE